MFQRKLRTRFDLLLTNRADDKREGNKTKGRNVQFKEGEYVYCRDYRNPNKEVFTRCILDEVLGSRTYLCSVG